MKFSKRTTHSAKLSNKLTKQQYKAAIIMFDSGSFEFYMFPFSNRNRPAWKLVEMGLAIHDFGPRGAWLITYCFMPIWSDPVC